MTYERAWNVHDPAACAACFAPGGVREFRLLLPCGSLGHREPVVRGRADIEEHIGRVLDAVPDLSIEVLGAAYSSDRHGSRSRNSRTPSGAKQAAQAAGSWTFHARSYVTSSSSCVTRGRLGHPRPAGHRP